ncbi:MAG: hypothetical protein R3C26_04675 [Calditrichia bacterium]
MNCITATDFSESQHGCGQCKSAVARGGIADPEKLVEKVYGLASASYFTSRYQNPGEMWRNRVFDNRFTFSVEGGFKPNNRWEFSLRWIFAGGAPYAV